MAWARWRGKRLQIGWKDTHGIERQRMCKETTLTAARRLADDLERKAERPRLGLEDAPLERALFSDVAEFYLETGAVQHRSYAQIESRFRLHILPEFGAKYLDEIRPADIMGFLGRKKEAGLSPQTREHLRVHLQAVFTFAIRDSKVFRGSNPASEVEKVRVPKREIRFVEREFVPLIIAAVSDRWRSLFAVAVYTGLRKGELLGLHARDVDLPNGVIRVFRSYDGETKSTKPRTVPIPEELVPFLRVELGRVRSEHLFPATDGSMQGKDLDLAGLFRTALKAVGLVLGHDHVCRRKGCGFLERRADAAPSRCPKCEFQLWPKAIPMNLSFKDLRSTFGTYAYEATGDIRFVQAALGHHDPRLTEERYSTLRNVRLREQGRKISFATDDSLTSGDGTGAPRASVASISMGPRGKDECGMRESNPRPLAPEANAPTLRRSGSGSQTLGSVGVSSGGRFAALGAVPQVSPKVADGGLTPGLVAHRGESLLTVREVADLLGVTPATIYKHVQRGGLRAVRIGALLRFRADDVTAFVDGGVR